MLANVKEKLIHASKGTVFVNSIRPFISIYYEFL